VFRYARQTFAAWPGDLVAKSLLPCISRPAALLGFYAPRRFAPADGCRAISGVPGPRVVSLAARPPRFIFVGVTDRLVEAVGRRLFLVRDVRLLGFAPVYDPYPAAPLESVGHGIDPASGFASCRVVGACLRIPIGLDPDGIISLRDPAARVSLRPAHPNPLMGFDACADDEPAHSPSLQRIVGADALPA